MVSFALHYEITNANLVTTYDEATGRPSIIDQDCSRGCKNSRHSHESFTYGSFMTSINLYTQYNIKAFSYSVSGSKLQIIP